MKTSALTTSLFILVFGSSLLLPSEGVTQCEQDYDRFMRAKTVLDEQNRELWAVKMADSYGSFPIAGMMEGNIQALGSYSSCLEADADGDFRGKFCYVLPYVESNFEGGSGPLAGDDASERGLVKPLLPPYGSIILDDPTNQLLILGANVGMCVPSTCSDAQVQDLILANLSETTGSVPFANRFLLFDCNSADDADRDPDRPELTGADIAYIAILSVLGILIILGTAADARRILGAKSAQSNAGERRPLLSPTDGPTKAERCILSFSLYTNVKRLLDCSPPRGDQIPCLDGIRFWSMTWVMVLHTYDYTDTYNLLPLINREELDTVLLDKFGYRVVYNSLVCVDSFFLIGGCLLAYITFKELDGSGGKLNVPMFYLHRYIRLTGVYAVLIGFFATLYKFCDFGAVNYVQYYVKPCQDTWWRNLLYTNNFFYPDDYNPCMGHTWYLAAEFQMFLFTPLALLPMWHLRKRYGGVAPSLAWCSLFLLGAWITLLSLSFSREWTSNNYLLGSDPSEGDFLINFYYMAWTRCPPYIIGIGLGFVLHVTKKKGLKINALLVLALWAIAFATGLALVYAMDINEYVLTNTGPSKAANGLFNSFSRSAWGFAMAWLVFACFHGYGGFINTFLSWEAFGPLGRLAFNMYLLHFMIAPLLYAQIRTTVVATHLLLTFIILNVFVWSLVGAFVLSVCFEIPIISCERLLLGKARKPRKKEDVK